MKNWCERAGTVFNKENYDEVYFSKGSLASVTNYVTYCDKDYKMSAIFMSLRETLKLSHVLMTAFDSNPSVRGRNQSPSF